MAIVGVEPSTAAFGNEVKLLCNAGVSTFEPISQRGGLIQRSTFLRSILSKLRPDIVIAHSILPSIYARVAKVSGLSFRLVTVLHCDSDFKSWKLRWTDRLLTKLHDAVVGVSAEACKNYDATSGSQRQAILIENGIEMRDFTYDGTDPFLGKVERIWCS